MTGLIAAGVVAVIVICAADILAPRVKAAPPLVLVVVGIALSFVPALGTFELEPDLVLEVILPPLLYASAVAMPAISFKRELSAISGLSVTLVVLSSLLLGLLFWWLVPGLGFGWGVALGAILSPTDAVATSIIKGRGVPDRVVTILEGESLLNDATALVILATAAGAAVHGFSVAGAVGSFLYSVIVALLIGAIVGVGNFWFRRRIENATADTVLSFTLPFIASVPAELLGSSGLVAAVVAGLIIGFRGPRTLPPQHRLTTGITWSSVQMVLEGVVFLTMGLQIKAVLTELHEDSVGVAAGLGIAVVALVVIVLTRSGWLAGDLWHLGRRARRGAART
ncbi:cation:proton antiporter [Brachybacterium huguangmaarense]|uniref:Cation:proton antiporter n=1 Tax=Brachybacterium huguangmaarense TaxID=1652028 RepID=A0ABY6G3F9_9MICO|nr:cation:proton antiporter [Brachybacterium huguangmaarense]UYG17748.1 cation:proton antiporter [Brachybacterium huguangmaarense]